MPSSAFPSEAPFDCARCPRLFAFRADNARAHPDWFNGPVRSFGDETAELLVVGLAPGMNGANRTGRPFTGDYAGDLLYGTLLEFGFASGQYEARPDDGLVLRRTMITNAVRCLPPQNKPTGIEEKNCRPFLLSRLSALPELRAILALGGIAHANLLSAHGLKKTAYPFGHGNEHDLGKGVRLFDSYHCSRYNTNTRRLTTEMFHDVFRQITAYLG